VDTGKSGVLRTYGATDGGRRKIEIDLQIQVGDETVGSRCDPDCPLKARGIFIRLEMETGPRFRPLESRPDAAPQGCCWPLIEGVDQAPQVSLIDLYD